MILLERFVVQLHLILHPSSLPWPCAVQLHLLLHPSGRLEQFAVQLATSGVPGWMTSGGVRTSLDQATLGPWLKGIFFNSSPDFARAFRRHQSPDSSMLCCLRQARGFILAIPKKPITDNTFDPLELLQVLCKDFWDCRTGLSYFAKASLSPTCIVHGPQPRSLWPAPPGGYGWQQPDKIFDSVVAASSLKPGQKMLNLLLCTLNSETLGQPKAPPPCAQWGAPISKQQPGVIERLEALLTHCLRMPQFDGHELGWAAGKFQGFIDSLQ